jgi:hypothetical protein
MCMCVFAIAVVVINPYVSSSEVLVVSCELLIGVVVRTVCERGMKNTYEDICYCILVRSR